MLILFVKSEKMQQQKNKKDCVCNSYPPKQSQKINGEIFCVKQPAIQTNGLLCLQHKVPIISDKNS